MFKMKFFNLFLCMEGSFDCFYYYSYIIFREGDSKYFNY